MPVTRTRDDDGPAADPYAKGTLVCRVRDLLDRLRAVRAGSHVVGRDLGVLETEIDALEAEIAEQSQALMANRMQHATRAHTVVMLDRHGLSGRWGQRTASSARVRECAPAGVSVAMESA